MDAIRTHAEGFSAVPGENFIFSDTNGVPWKGTCTELRATGNGTVQIRGRVRKGPEEFADQDVIINYNPVGSEVSVIQS
jgi:hypothetical protein